MKILKKLIKLIVGIFLVLVVIVVGMNFYLVATTNNLIIGKSAAGDSSTIVGIEDIKKEKWDCILVLGAGVNPDGTPSKMLKDRLDVAVALYKGGAAEVVLVSGDNGQVEYNEVEVMKNYIVKAGVPKAAIYMDHAGFSTYESMYRAKAIFSADKVLVVTQKYHLYRALYIGKKLGLDVKGVGSDPKVYIGQTYRSLREVLARDKDLIKCIYKPEPTFLGDPIPLK